MKTRRLSPAEKQTPRFAAWNYADAALLGGSLAVGVVFLLKGTSLGSVAGGLSPVVLFTIVGKIRNYLLQRRGNEKED